MMTPSLSDDDTTIKRSKTLTFRSPVADTLPTVSFSKNESSLKYTESSNMLLPTEHKLSLFQKLCFAVGGLPFQMTSSALGLYMPAFLLENAQIRPAQVSVVLFSAKGWDALSDPVVGYFVSKTRTRFGKLRPWILFASPFAVVSYMMLWYLPDISRSLKTFWYLLFFCLFQSSLSCLHVPFTSLTMYITPTQSERDSATGYRMLFEVSGVLLAALIQGLMISIYGSKVTCSSSTKSLLMTTMNPLGTNQSAYETTNYASQANHTSTSVPSTDYNEMGTGFLLSAGIMSIIYLACCLTTFFGTKEITDVAKEVNINYFASVKKIFKHKSYLTLLFTFLCNSLAVQLVQTNIALYCKYAIPAKSEYQIILIVLLAASIVSLPIWQYILIRFGKKTAYAGGLIIFLPNLFALLFIEDQIWLMYIIATLSGLSIAVSFLCPWSMLPDVIDEYALLHGERNEPIFYAFYVFFTKLALGFAIGLSQITLELSGYIDCPDGCCQQPKAIELALRMLVVPGPVILILMSLVFLWLHSIDETKRRDIKEKLNDRRLKMIEETEDF